MKKYFYLATALVALAACSGNEFVGDQESLNSSGGGAISFSMNTPAVTRADKAGATAAADLNSQFIVWGEKNEASGSAATTGNLVFKNYLVDWIDNSAYTTTSNTKGWEYVGLKFDDGTASPATTTYSTNISPNSGTGEQTIKYWDYGATSYTYTAVSALPSDITAGNVKITKTESGSTVYDKGYSVTLNGSADLDKLYFAERNNITSSANTDRTQKNTYGGNVTFRFHNAATKVRVAMYETVPGYSVTIKEFKVNDAVDPAFSAMTTSKTANFAANFVNNAEGTAGSMTVKYVSSGDRVNHPTVSFTPTSAAANILNLGTGLKENILIGENKTAATYDKDGKAYTSVFPKEDNAQNLKLKVSYTLKAPITNETIEVTDKTAEIPAQYLKWKPGYAYTYIFKITDDALYPITFDAVEVVDEDGLAEYITTVTEPSITTFGAIYNTSTSKYTAYQTGKNEYQTQTSPNRLDIYATIMDGSAVKDFTLGTDVNVYLVTTTNATTFPITEASVAEALAESPVGSAQISCVNKNSDGTTSFGAAPVEVTTVPGEDGIDITGTHALKLTGAVATTGTTAYAIEYIKTAATYHTQTVAIADQAALDAYVGTLYTDADGTTEASSTFDGGVTYYKRTTVKNVGKYAYKVIKVQ